MTGVIAAAGAPGGGASGAVGNAGADCWVVDSPCPSCRARLDRREVDGLYGRRIAIDVCGACQGIWFDAGESLQLSPGGTLALFRIVHEHRAAVRHPLAARLVCPRCGARLKATQDRQRSTRFEYHACPEGHGRFITFYHFLRARHFVRALTPGEVADLRRRVRQVACASCGAPVDLERHSACSYCRAPIAMLDPDQVERTLRELAGAEAQRRRVDPALPLKLMMARAETEAAFRQAQGGARTPVLSVAVDDGSLVERGLELLLRALRAGE